MTVFNRLTIIGHVHHLRRPLGNSAITILGGERYIALASTWDLASPMYPDLMIPFDVSPVNYDESNAYLILEPGKPPDFVLQIASGSTGRRDINQKRDIYQYLRRTLTARRKGESGWRDPDSGPHILTFYDLQSGADQEAARWQDSEAAPDAQRQARAAAEARARVPEDEIRRLRAS